MDNKKMIGQRINTALVLRDKKQKELAAAIGVTDNTVSYFCSGRRAPNLQQIGEIAKELCVSTDYLLCLSDVPSRDENVINACSYTGLNNVNATRLHAIVEAIQKNPYTSQREQVFLYAINEIISSQQFLNILGKIWEAYCIEHQRAFNGLVPKYSDKKEAAQKMDEIRANFESYVRFGLTKERIVSGDVAISVLLNDAREAISSISKDIIKTNILESDKEGDDGKH